MRIDSDEDVTQLRLPAGRQEKQKYFIAARFPYSRILSHDSIRTRPQVTSPPPLFSVLVAVPRVHFSTRGPLSVTRPHLIKRHIFCNSAPYSVAGFIRVSTSEQPRITIRSRRALRNFVGDQRATCGNSDDIRSFLTITTPSLE